MQKESNASTIRKGIANLGINVGIIMKKIVIISPNTISYHKIVLTTYKAIVNLGKDVNLIMESRDKTRRDQSVNCFREGCVKVEAIVSLYTYRKTPRTRRQKRSPAQIKEKTSKAWRSVVWPHNSKPYPRH